MFFQEHLVPASRHHVVTATMAALDRTVVLSPTDPEAGRQAAGVGVVTPRATPAVRPKFVTQDFRRAYDLGRADLTLLRLSPNLVVLVFNVYLWSGAQRTPLLRDRGNSVLTAIMEEIRAQPRLPVFVVGDFNAVICRFPALAVAFAQGNLIDFGAIDWPSCPAGTETCFMTGPDVATRRDYILASPEQPLPQP